jgi:hypothetical protein
LVGKARRALIAPYINDLAMFEGIDKKYSELNEGEKVKVLEVLYEMGYNKGKEQFLELHKEFKKDEVEERE